MRESALVEPSKVEEVKQENNAELISFEPIVKIPQSKVEVEI